MAATGVTGGGRSHRPPAVKVALDPKIKSKLPTAQIKALHAVSATAIITGYSKYTLTSDISKHMRVAVQLALREIMPENGEAPDLETFGMVRGVKLEGAGFGGPSGRLPRVRVTLDYMMSSDRVEKLKERLDERSYLRVPAVPGFKDSAWLVRVSNRPLKPQPIWLDVSGLPAELSMEVHCDLVCNALGVTDVSHSQRYIEYNSQAAVLDRMLVTVPADTLLPGALRDGKPGTPQLLEVMDGEEVAFSLLASIFDDEAYGRHKEAAATRTKEAEEAVARAKAAAAEAVKAAAEQQRKAAAEEQQRKAAAAEQQSKAAAEEQQRKAAAEEEQRRAAAEEQQRKEAAETQRKAAAAAAAAKAAEEEAKAKAESARKAAQQQQKAMGQTQLQRERERKAAQAVEAPTVPAPAATSSTSQRPQGGVTETSRQASPLPQRVGGARVRPKSAAGTPEGRPPKRPTAAPARETAEAVAALEMDEGSEEEGELRGSGASGMEHDSETGGEGLAGGDGSGSVGGSGSPAALAPPNAPVEDQ